jgi:hypothetical protein
VTWEEYTSEAVEIYVKRWDGFAWAEVGSGSAGGGGISQVGGSYNPDIAVAPDGTPYITWYANEGFGNIEIYVRRWDGNAWVAVGPGSASQGGISDNPGLSRWPSIAIAPDSTPYIAWEDENGIYIRRWNGAVWEEVGAGSASGGGIAGGDGSNVSLAIGPDGVPYAAWEGFDGYWQIYVRRWNGSTWEEVGAGSASGGGISDNDTHSNYPEIAIGLDGTPYVVWMDAEGWPSEEYYIVIRRWDGTSWVEVGEGSSGWGGISGTIGSSYYPSVIIAPDGTPYVTWDQWDEAAETVDIYVRRWDGSGWEEAGPGSGSAGGISNTGHGYHSSINVALDGTLYVVWSDNFPGGLVEIYIRSCCE